MRLETGQYLVKQQKDLSKFVLKFDLCCAIDITTNKSVQFDVLNIDYLDETRGKLPCPTIQPGMFIKISVDWNCREYMNESFWVEITNVNIDGNGGVHLFGTCANDTERISYGSIIGPIYPRNILQIGD